MNIYRSLEEKGLFPKLLFALILISLAFPQLSFGQYTKWYKDTIVNGIEFEKLKFRNDGNTSFFVTGYLKQATIIEGYPCHKEVKLDKNGDLRSFILSDDFVLAGNNFKKETQVIIRNNGDFLIHCLYNPIVQTYHIKRENYKRLFFSGSTNFSLYPSGKLKYFNHVDVIEIQGVWCKPSAVRGGISLYESGKMKECTSAKEQTINDKLVGKNFTLKFNKDGTLLYAKKEKIFD